MLSGFHPVDVWGSLDTTLLTNQRNTSWTLQKIKRKCWTCSKLIRKLAKQNSSKFPSSLHHKILTESEVAIRRSQAVAQRCSVKNAEACNCIKKETPAQVFSCEFYDIFKNTFFYRATQVAASDRCSIKRFTAWFYWNKKLRHRRFPVNFCEQPIFGS